MLLLIWEGAYRSIGWKPYVFPAPSHVLDALLAMMDVRSGFGEPIAAGWPFLGGAADASVARSPLITAQVVSLSRLLSGFVVSLVLGGMLGLAMWRIRGLDRLFGPLFLGLQTLPSVCWVPLAILLLGLDERAILFVLIMGSFFAIAIGLRDGLRTIPPVYQRAGLMLGARGWRLYLYVLLPASLPAMASSLRQGFSFAWRSLMGAELILASQHAGLGRLLAVAREVHADIARVVAVMLVMVLIGMLADRWGFAKLQEYVQRRFGLTAR